MMMGRLPKRIFHLLVVPALFLIVWGILSIANIFPSYLLPPLKEVILGGYDLATSGELLRHITASLYRVVSGLTIAIFTGVPLGILMGRSERISSLFEGVLHILRHIPPIAWIPFALLWFRGGLASAAFVVSIGAFFPILLNTIAGVKGVPRGLIEVGYTLGCSSREITTKIVLPYSTPNILTGIRIGLGIGWMSVVAAEYFGYNFGLGALIIFAYNILRIDLMVVAMITIGFVGLIIDRAFKWLENRLTKWRGK